ncbi:hypothetical protein KIPB_005649, partial [Kipferlia bialata]|eukprot:g5649.t1
MEAPVLQPKKRRPQRSPSPERPSRETESREAEQTPRSSGFFGRIFSRRTPDTGRERRPSREAERSRVAREEPERERQEEERRPAPSAKRVPNQTPSLSVPASGTPLTMVSPAIGVPMPFPTFQSPYPSYGYMPMGTPPVNPFMPPMPPMTMSMPVPMPTYMSPQVQAQVQPQAQGPIPPTQAPAPAMSMEQTMQMIQAQQAQIQVMQQQQQAQQALIASLIAKQTASPAPRPKRRPGAGVSLVTTPIGLASRTIRPSAQPTSVLAQSAMRMDSERQREAEEMTGSRVASMGTP